MTRTTLKIHTEAPRPSGSRRVCTLRIRGVSTSVPHTRPLSAVARCAIDHGALSVELRCALADDSADGCVGVGIGGLLLEYALIVRWHDLYELA